MALFSINSETVSRSILFMHGHALFCCCFLAGVKAC